MEDTVKQKLGFIDHIHSAPLNRHVLLGFQPYTISDYKINRLSAYKLSATLTSICNTIIEAQSEINTIRHHQRVHAHSPTIPLGYKYVKLVLA